MEDQAFLDAIVDGSRARDFEAFERHMALPLTVILPGGTLTVADAADLRAGFEGDLAALDGHGVTDYVRVATSMTWVGPSLAAGAYDTHLLRNGQRVVEPFASVAMLRREDEAWRLASVMHAMAHDRWRFRLPGSGDDAGGWGLWVGRGGESRSPRGRAIDGARAAVVGSRPDSGAADEHAAWLRASTSSASSTPSWTRSAPATSRRSRSGSACR